MLIICLCSEALFLGRLDARSLFVDGLAGPVSRGLRVEHEDGFGPQPERLGGVREVEGASRVSSRGVPRPLRCV